MRIQKWIAELGLASRREAERWIEQGRISINGRKIHKMGVVVDPIKDVLAIDDKIISKTPPPKVYWLLNKPDKVLTSRPDGTERRTIYHLDSLKSLSFLVAPVGRLDYRTQGLLLMSNDGDMVYRLTHPKFKLPRHYQVLVNRRLNQDEHRQFVNHLPLEDGPVKKTELEYAHSDKARGGFWYFITVYEGRNRLVRRMFEHFHIEVKTLIRIGFGNIKLDHELKPGHYRALKGKEIKDLKSYGVVKQRKPLNGDTKEGKDNEISVLE